jgi:Zonular occludens toxin (Zot)
MITLITGAPGSGKSAALVDLLSLLAQGRELYVHGIPDFKVPHIELHDPRKWMQEVPDGAAVALDEVQTVWRPAASGSRVPEDIAALETHRHRGIDFFIVTQHPGLLHKNVRALVGRHVHLRDLGFLGRRWYEWPECSESLNWRSADARAYKLPTKALSLYKSASVHVKPVRRIPKAVMVAALALVGAVGLAGYFAFDMSKRIEGPTQAEKEKVEPEKLPVALVEPSAVAQAVGSKVGPVTGLTPGFADVEPFDGMELHYQGLLDLAGKVRHLFSASDKGRTHAFMTGDDLLKAGYTITVIAPCIVRLGWGQGHRVARCDAPKHETMQQNGMATGDAPAAHGDKTALPIQSVFKS